MSHVVVIGAGQAGASAVARLRAKGFDGAITLLGDEPHPPYQRPPLSKAYLLGEMELARLFLRPAEFYAEHSIRLITATKATAIDTTTQTVTLGTGEALGYSDLILATGATPRRLPAAIGGDLGGVYTMRSLDDADAIAPEFAAGRRLLVVGGGYIGLEAAAVAAKLGLQVTVLEMAPRILQRVAAAETAAHFRALHLAHGVDIREGTGLERLIGETRVSGAVLSDGHEMAVDFVIAGVGVTPNTQLAEAAGLTLDNGIATDAMGQTSAPHIWAAGDCASFPQGDTRIRLESVGNAIDMAECVADNIMGAARPYLAKPWFWSDQYDCKLQIAGLNSGYDRVITRKGEGAAVSFWYYAGARLLAVDAANDPRAYMVGKRLIEAGRSPDPDLVAQAPDVKALM